ncbi:F-box family protein with a domain of Uncharacterized protein function, putative [Theobroma cacao]|uniref:F-box family protein with a domain of Uncharacterized protein function, putative n=1 Tax=Theobroma cacao TaxID=3641 RepID=A0A061E0S9_THECC|nr:F-box family protein with a domain of Uncharacterized protein function, putative [Theobroma cacao]
MYILRSFSELELQTPLAHKSTPMAQKVKNKKNKKQVPPKKANNGAVTWPDLPQILVDIIAKQPALMQDISYGGLTKLCRSPPSKCNPNNFTPPCLQLFDEINVNSDENYVEPNLNVSFHRRWFWYWYFSRWARPPVRSYWKHYVGFSNEAIVAKGNTFSDPKSSELVYLWYPVDGYSFSRLPEWDERIPFTRVVVSSSARYLSNKNRTTVMVLTGTSHPAFVFYQLRGEGRREWVKQDCTLTEPHCSMKSEGKHFMTFTNAIGFNGRFYVLSLQGTLAVIDATDSYPRITTISSERAVPSVLPKHFREYLLESEGNILLVFLISRRSIKVVDDVEVFQLNTAKLSWVRMASLGDRALFLGTNCCMSVSASRVGCRSNCVYFTYHTADGWWVFDMEKSCISPGWSDAATTSPVWTAPIQEE